jgi:hypothetical protein
LSEEGDAFIEANEAFVDGKLPFDSSGNLPIILTPDRSFDFNGEEVPEGARPGGSAGAGAQQGPATK